MTVNIDPADEDLDVLFNIANAPPRAAGDPQIAALMEAIDLGPSRPRREAIEALERAATDLARIAANREWARLYLVRLGQP